MPIADRMKMVWMMVCHITPVAVTVEQAFDIEALARQCRFSDCGHSNEPGCAVNAAIEKGELTEVRYAHYCKLRDERDAAAVTLAQRRAEEKELLRQAGKRAKDKYGRR